MMKKIAMTFLLVMMTVITATAGKDKRITVSQLPAKAQTLLKQHFAEKKVSYVKMEDEWMSKSYDVVFVDGGKVEFDKKGEWKELDFKRSSVPTRLIPNAILTYVNQYYPDQYVVKIDKGRRRYEVKLDNELELIFDLQGRFLGMDD